MADDQASRLKAESQKEKPLFAARMIRVVDQPGILVEKYGLRLIERDAVLGLIRFGFARVQAKTTLPTALFSNTFIARRTTRGELAAEPSSGQSLLGAPCSPTCNPITLLGVHENRY
jgi:hypothetical protein